MGYFCNISIGKTVWLGTGSLRRRRYYLKGGKVPRYFRGYFRWERVDAFVQKSYSKSITCLSSLLFVYFTKLHKNLVMWENVISGYFFFRLTEWRNVILVLPRNTVMILVFPSLLYVHAGIIVPRIVHCPRHALW